MSDVEKILALSAIFFLLVPLSTAMMFAKPKLELSIVFIAVLLSSFGDRFGFSIDYDFDYRGTISGYSVQLCDLLYISLFLRSVSRRIALEGKLLLFLYGAYWLSTVFASLASDYHDLNYWKYGLFESLKFFFILYYFSTSIDNQRAKAVFTALCCAALLHGVYFLAERYAFGVHRVSGVFNHPNLVSSVVLLLFSPLLYVALCGNVLTSYQRLGSFISALLISTGAILTVSRAMVVIYSLGAVFITLIAVLKNYRAVRYYVLVLAVVALSAGVKGYDTFSHTFVLKGFQGGGRQEMNELALSMFSRSVSGVGFNNFSVAANDYGVESMQAAYTGKGLPPVHNVYLLTLAEVGVVGLLSYSAFLLFPLLVSLRNTRGLAVQSFGSVFAQGLSIGVCLLYLQAILEDSPRREFVMYFLYPFLGLLVAIASQRLDNNANNDPL